MNNQVTMVGSVWDEIKVQTLQNGSKVARFKMEITDATTHTKAKHQLNFYRMFAWGNTAKFISEYCEKGAKVAISGKLVNRTYLDKDGYPKRVHEVEVRQVMKM